MRLKRSGGGQIKVRREIRAPMPPLFGAWVRLSESRVAIKPGDDTCLGLRDLVVDPLSFKF